ncbi:hypothetical protein GJD58_28565, partial [Klebsiella pneumoniae]|nr:hypothetical protein [Klebsiella pneumoniae]
EGLHHTAIMHSQNVSRLNLAARTLQTSIFVKNGPSYAGIGVGASFSLRMVRIRVSSSAVFIDEFSR